MPKVVFLVEDDADTREDLAFLLADRGYAVETASDGAEALGKLAQHPPPSAIVLDLMMPVMDGWELRAKLRKDPRLSAVPVILVSGVADLEGQARSLDAVGYLTKPVDLPRLFDLLAAHV